MYYNYFSYWLIQKTKQPKRYFTTTAHFYIVGSNESIVQSCHLTKVLLRPADFDCICAIDHEVAFLRQVDVVTGTSKLVDKKAFADTAYILWLRGYSIEQVRIVQQQFSRFLHWS